MILKESDFLTSSQQMLILVEDQSQEQVLGSADANEDACILPGNSDSAWSQIPPSGFELQLLLTSTLRSRMMAPLIGTIPSTGKAG